MSRPVDRQARRAEILDGFQRYVARVGLPSATSRGLAAEVDMAAGALWKYFDNFEEVVVEGYRHSFDALFDRLDAHLDEPGLPGLEAALSVLLPFTAEGQFDGRVALGYLGLRGKYEDLVLIEGEMERRWAQHIRTHLDSAQNAGELKESTDAEALTEILLVVIIGLQMQWAVPNSANGSPERQRDVLRQVLGPWLTDNSQFFPEDTRAMHA